MDSGSQPSKKLVLEKIDDLQKFFGAFDEHLKIIENAFGVTISARGTDLILHGNAPDITRAEIVLRNLETMTADGYEVSRDEFLTAIRNVDNGKDSADIRDLMMTGSIIETRKKKIYPKTPNQKRYIDAMISHNLVFGIGPAGTGKTYLAVAMAVTYLIRKQVSRIVLARPAVEAGENLGFLPGDMYEKVNPYLRPLYDALYDMLDVERANRMIERGVIEIAPIAFMRGRTLNDSFIILDEAQNTTSEQMKMFLTRLGFNAKAVVTGDITQIDLRGERKSGLVEVRNILNHVRGIEFIYLTGDDVVRCQLVRDIVAAYERHER
ncbi:PhoH family protein [bacterium]|nr:PhoH family protein [candidate division CSSED10-310 bacterium]